MLVSVPVKAFGDIPVKPLAGKPVLDTGNYYPQRDGHIAELDTGALTSSGLLQRDLPDAQVVKVFNNIFFKHLGSLARPHGAEDRTALPIAGDSAAAKAAVTAFLGLDRLRRRRRRLAGRQLAPGTRHPRLRHPLRPLLRRGRHPRPRREDPYRPSRRPPLAGFPPRASGLTPRPGGRHGSSASSCDGEMQGERIPREARRTGQALGWIYHGRAGRRYPHRGPDQGLPGHRLRRGGQAQPRRPQPGRSSASSARTAPARPPRPACSPPAWSRPPAGPSSPESTSRPIPRWPSS